MVTSIFGQENWAAESLISLPPTARFSSIISTASSLSIRKNEGVRFFDIEENENSMFFLQWNPSFVFFRPVFPFVSRIFRLHPSFPIFIARRHANSAGWGSEWRRSSLSFLSLNRIVDEQKYSARCLFRFISILFFVIFILFYHSYLHELDFSWANEELIVSKELWRT